MNILTVIAATLYAVLLWLFAPQSVWDAEVTKAKANATPKTPETPQEATKTPEKLEIDETAKTPQTALQTSNNTQKGTLQDSKDTQDTQQTVEIPETTKNWTVAQLRKLAQQRQIKWRDENGKPLKKNELMKILAV